MPKATEAASVAKLILPTEVVQEVSEKIQERSVVASLCPSEPESFVSTEYVSFTEDPEGEFVGEGAEKSSADWGIASQEAKLHKFQVTVRMNEEVRWADEDNQTRILNALLTKMQEAQARGLDYGLIHAINPLSREVLPTMKDEAIAYNAVQVAATDDPVKDLDNLPEKIIENYDINGIALDRMYAYSLRNVRVPNTGQRQFPEIGLSLDPGSVDGIRSVTSGAVAGRRLAPTPTGIKAILGNWSLVKWGFARDLEIEEILYGDPDGLGDLKRHNQVAYRTECVFGWRVLDMNGLAVLRDSSTIPVALSADSKPVAKKSE